jgi:hypothetical protein
MSRPLSSVACITPPLIGGIDQLWIVRSADVLVIPAPTSLQGNFITQAVTLRPGKSFTKLNFARGAARYKFKPISTEQGTIYDAEITLDTRGLRWDHSLEITKLTPGAYLMAIKDRDGNRFLVGSPERPLRFKAEGDSNAVAGDTPGAQWTFTGKMIYQPLFWAPNVTDFPAFTNGTGGGSIEFGEYEDDEFTPQLGAVINPAVDGLNSLSGLILDAQGRPFTPEGNPVQLELTFTNYATGNGVPGMVLFDYAADVNLASAAAVGGQISSWPTAMRDFITAGGTGAFSDSGLPGGFDLHISRAGWIYSDDMPLQVEARIVTPEASSRKVAALLVE